MARFRMERSGPRACPRPMSEPSAPASPPAPAVPLAWYLIFAALAVGVVLHFLLGPSMQVLFDIMPGSGTA